MREKADVIKNRMEIMCRRLDGEIIAMFLNEPGTRDVTTCLGYSTTRRFVPVPALVMPRGFSSSGAHLPGRQATLEECAALLYCLTDLFKLPVFWVERVFPKQIEYRREKLMAAGVQPAVVPLTDGLALPVPFTLQEKP